LLYALFFRLLGWLAATQAPEIIKISGSKMGTSYHITVVADQPAPADLAQRIELRWTWLISPCPPTK